MSFPLNSLPLIEWQGNLHHYMKSPARFLIHWLRQKYTGAPEIMDLPIYEEQGAGWLSGIILCKYRSQSKDHQGSRNRHNQHPEGDIPIQTEIPAQKTILKTIVVLLL